MRRISSPNVDEARRTLKALREQVKAGGGIRAVDLERLTTRLEGPGISQSVADWRIAARDEMGRALRDPHHPYSEWLSGEVHLPLMLADPFWERFWLFEVSSSAMPRAWLRWATEMLQATIKWSDGAPGDVQLSTYVTQADCLVTADRRFAQLLEAARPAAPVEFALTRVLEGGREGVPAFLQWLREPQT